MEVVEYVELDDIHPFVAGNGLCLVRQLGSLNFRNARDADWTKMSKTDYTYTTPIQLKTHNCTTYPSFRPVHPMGGYGTSCPHLLRTW